MGLSSSPRLPAASSPPMCGAPQKSSSSSARRSSSPPRRRPVSGSPSTASHSRMRGRTPPTGRTARSQRFSRFTRNSPAVSTSSSSDSRLASESPGAPPDQANRREIVREHRAARQPRSNPATVGLPGRQRGGGHGHVDEQRRLLRELLSAQPLPADVTVTAAALGGVPTAEIAVDGVEPRHVVLYF